MASVTIATPTAPKHWGCAISCRRGTARVASTASLRATHPKVALALSTSVCRPTVAGCRTTTATRSSGCSRIITHCSLADSPLVRIVGDDGSLSNEISGGAGVYAVFDAEDKLQYVGLSRKVVASVVNHMQVVPTLCVSVKVAEVPSGDRKEMQDKWQEWVKEHVETTGEAPPGNVNAESVWTKRAVRRVKPEIKLTPGGNKELTVSMQELIDQLVKDRPLLLFLKGTRTAPECGFSHKVLTMLNEFQADYDTVNVLDEEYNPGLRDAIKEYSDWPTIPQLYAKGEFIGGADIVEEMYESGELKEMLAEFKKAN